MMTGTPSEAGKQIRELVCRKTPHFTDCCCAAVVGKFWRDVLPPDVRNAVANFDLATDFDKAMDHADNVFQSVKAGPAASAILGGRMAAVSLDETQPALQYDVAAYKNQGAKPKQKPQQQQQQPSQQRQQQPGQARRRRQRDPANRDTWGNPHRDWQGKTPPSSICMQHFVFGKKAHFCRIPSSCPWSLDTCPPIDG